MISFFIFGSHNCLFESQEVQAKEVLWGQNRENIGNFFKVMCFHS